MGQRTVHGSAERTVLGIEDTGYGMEELLPVVAWLAEKYTSGESTSVTYERARQLMGAVLYCLKTYRGTGDCGKVEWKREDAGILVSGKEKKVSARLAYEQGYRVVTEKTEITAQAYNELILSFHSYGNENYEDTVKKALSGFFLYYDARFAPQETIITMDYPTLVPVNGETGIHAVARYIHLISLEQKFLGKLPSVYVCNTLRAYCIDYKNMFFNISNIVLRDLLLCIITGKTPGMNLEDHQKNKLKTVAANDRAGLEDTLEEALETLIREKYDKDRQLYDYLKSDIKNFSMDLQWL